MFVSGLFPDLTLSLDLTIRRLKIILILLLVLLRLLFPTAFFFNFLLIVLVWILALSFNLIYLCCHLFFCNLILSLQKSQSIIFETTFVPKSKNFHISDFQMFILSTYS